MKVYYFNNERVIKNTRSFPTFQRDCLEAGPWFLVFFAFFGCFYTLTLDFCHKNDIATTTIYLRIKPIKQLLVKLEGFKH